MDHEALAASERRIHVGPRVDSRAPVGALAQSERWFLSKASRGHRAPVGGRSGTRHSRAPDWGTTLTRCE
jgi:hypothetical protein